MKIKTAGISLRKYKIPKFHVTMEQETKFDYASMWLVWLESGCCSTEEDSGVLARVQPFPNI